MSYIFISYCRADAEIANELKQRFASIELDCWVDKDNIYSGEAWQSAIEEGIWGCDALVVIVSEKSTKSLWVTYEWIFALGAKKPVFPVLIDDVKEYHPRLQGIHSQKYDDPSAMDKLIQHLLRAMNQFHSSVTPQMPQELRNLATRAFSGISSSDEETKYAINQIARTNHPSARSILANALGNENRDIKIKVLVAMRDHKVHTIEAVDNLVKLYPDAGNLYYAVQELLIGIGQPVVDKLIPYLNSEDERIRLLVYSVFGKIEGFDQLNLFRQGLDDGSSQVRRTVVKALQTINNDESFDILLQTLSTETDFNVCQYIKEAFISMLNPPRKINFKEAIEKLETASTQELTDVGANVIRAVLSKFKR